MGVDVAQITWPSLFTLIYPKGVKPEEFSKVVEMNKLQLLIS